MMGSLCAYQQCQGNAAASDDSQEWIDNLLTVEVNSPPWLRQEGWAWWVWGGG